MTHTSSTLLLDELYFLLEYRAQAVAKLAVMLVILSMTKNIPELRIFYMIENGSLL